MTSSAYYKIDIHIKIYYNLLAFIFSEANKVPQAKPILLIK